MVVSRKRRRGHIGSPSRDGRAGHRRSRCVLYGDIRRCSCIFFSAIVVVRHVRCCTLGNQEYLLHSTCHHHLLVLTKRTSVPPRLLSIGTIPSTVREVPRVSSPRHERVQPSCILSQARAPRTRGIAARDDFGRERRDESRPKEGDHNRGRERHEPCRCVSHRVACGAQEGESPNGHFEDGIDVGRRRKLCLRRVRAAVAVARSVRNCQPCNDQAKENFAI